MGRAEFMRPPGHLAMSYRSDASAFKTAEVPQHVRAPLRALSPRARGRSIRGDSLGGPAVNAARLFFASRRSSHHVVVRRGAPTRRRPTAGSIADLAPPRPPPSLTTEPRGEARDRDALPRRGSPRHARPFVESVQLRRAKLPFPRQVRARVALHRGGAHGPFRGRPRGDRAGDP